MKSKKIFVGIFFLLFSIFGFAAKVVADPAPLAMLKNVTGSVLAELNKNIGHLKGNDELVNSIVNKYIKPRLDLDRMSQNVAGIYWKEATPVVQEQFKKEFTRYVIRTYAVAIESFDGGSIKFFTIRDTDIGERVKISSDLVLKDRPPIQLQYSLLKIPNGEWKIYDFSVNGVSITQNYKAQFASTLRQKKLSGLVGDLQKRNK